MARAVRWRRQLIFMLSNKRVVCASAHDGLWHIPSIRTSATSGAKRTLRACRKPNYHRPSPGHRDVHRLNRRQGLDQAKFQIKATKRIIFLIQNLKRVGRDFPRAVPETLREWSMVDGAGGDGRTEKIADSDLIMSAVAHFADSVGHFARSEKCQLLTRAVQ